MTSVHRWVDTRIYEKESRSLAALGYEVILVAPGEGRRIVNDVTIVGAKVAGTRLRRMTVGVLTVTFTALREHALLYHTHDPELLPAALLLRTIGKKVVIDVHEDLPAQIASKPWIPMHARPVAKLGARLIERLVSMVANTVVVAEPAVAARFHPGKVVLVQNYPIPDELSEVVTIPYESRPARVIYVGGVTRARGIEEMLSAIARVSRTHDARLAVVGGLSPAGLVTELAGTPGFENTHFYGWQDRGSVAELLQQARIGLVVLHPEPNYVDSQPTKLFEYMSVGLPVVASDFPRWRAIVEGARCGLLVDPHDPADIGAALDWLLSHPSEAAAMGRRGRAAVRNNFSWDSEALRLGSAYHELTHR